MQSIIILSLLQNAPSSALKLLLLTHRLLTCFNMGYLPCEIHVSPELKVPRLCHVQSGDVGGKMQRI